MTMIPWQDFTITGGAIARNPAGQIEGRLELAEGYMLSFLADATGITLGWWPDEPGFKADRLEDPDDDANDIALADHQVPEYMILVADGAAMVARRHPDGLGWQYVPADNWQELAEQALAEVYAQGGAMNLSGLYRCPRALAELGRWELPPVLRGDEDDL